MDEYCVSVLRARQKDGCLPMCSISSDVTEYHPNSEHRRAALVTAGFPCQAFQYFFRCLDVQDLILE